MDGQDTEALPSDQPDDVSREFGGRVRLLRERAGLTLEQFSRQSGVSRAMLSKVERGEKSPTIGVAKRIAGALSTSLSFLAGGEEERRAVSVIRREQRHIFRDEKTGFERHLLSPSFAGTAVELLFHLLPAGTSTGKLPPYPSRTEKYVVAVDGEVVFALPGLDVCLQEGDALYFEADVEHSFRNTTRAPCSYYVVITRRPTLS